MEAIRIEGITKSFGRHTVVNGVSFTVDSGTVTGFLGPNGAGKTTTLRCLLGLVRPDAGTALIHGRPYVELTEPTKLVGAVLEATNLHPGRTGRNHLRVLCDTAGIPHTRADEVLAEVGLTEAGRRRVGTYSLGMRQRLSMAGALLGDPKVLILDEPANGLDPQGIDWLRRFLRGLADRGVAVLVSSHVLAEVEQTVDKVVIISGGGLVAQGGLSELTGAGESLHDAFLRLTDSDGARVPQLGGTK
ncbi:ATP-binding cassette domain-containing protein [Nocardiopsis sp. N85]|uniref:ABC transporter ATP-binding protein n=1 Tax=Nocardiopsis sp. N85 TaxID=3029400 RepID=UPI00237F97EE|nr:ATP-binding cassette domain-containing protein [Nocardiopsis sp. N85]MDE3723112.1 ATP-binding cassette domain-containing protein [Nocardiopsis sp. N85]